MSVGRVGRSGRSVADSLFRPHSEQHARASREPKAITFFRRDKLYGINFVYLFKLVFSCFAHGSISQSHDILEIIHDAQQGAFAHQQRYAYEDNETVCIYRTRQKQKSICGKWNAPLKLRPRALVRVSQENKK